MKYALFIVWFVCSTLGVEARLQKAKNVSMEQLSNGLTYCLAHEDFDEDNLVVKLMIKFDDKFTTQKDTIISAIVEKMMVHALGSVDSLVDSSYVPSIVMEVPELYVVPQVILYKFKISNPSQEILSSLMYLLSYALEEIKGLSLDQIEAQIMDIINMNPSYIAQKLFLAEEGDYWDLEAYDHNRSPITAEEVKRFYDAHYRIENMVLFVNGNLTDLAVTEAIKQYFASLKGGYKSTAFQFVSEHPSMLPVKRVHSISYWPKERTERFWEEKSPVSESFKELPLVEKQEKTIEKLMHILANSSLPKLLWKQKELERMGRSINDVHPLRFIDHIITHPILRSDLQEVHRNFFKWKAFVDGFRRRMTEEYYKNNIAEFLPGFCASVDIKVEVAEHFIEHRDWEGLIKAILY